MQKKPNDFGLKYGNQKTKQNEKAEWINNMTRELEGHEEGPRVEIHTDLLKTTLKKISNWKTQGTWWNTWFLVQQIHLHSRETSTRNE